MTFRHKKSKINSWTMHNNTGAISKWSYKHTKRMKEVISLSLPGKISVHWDTGNQWICPQTAEGGADRFTATVFALKCSLKKKKKKFLFFFRSCQQMSCGRLPLQQSLTVHPAVLGNPHMYTSLNPVASESFQTRFHFPFYYVEVWHQRLYGIYSISNRQL